MFVVAIYLSWIVSVGSEQSLVVPGILGERQEGDANAVADGSILPDAWLDLTGCLLMTHV